MLSREESLGGGTGGGFDDSGNVLLSANGAYQIAGNQVVLLSRPPKPDLPAKQGPNVIIILAAGDLEKFDGQVDVRGSKGVRVTAGPPLILPTSTDSTNGIEIMVAEMPPTAEPKNITIQRGLYPLAQQIELTKSGTTIRCGLEGVFSPSIELDPDGIAIDGALPLGTVTIKAGQGITISAGPAEIKLGQDGIRLSAGLSEITLGLEGVTIKGVPVELNPPGAPRTWG